MLINPQLPLPGYLFGLTLANSTTNPNTTVSVASGVAADNTNTFLIQIPSAFTKVVQSTGTWSAGNGGNGLDTGSRTASTWYHVFLIRADSDGAGDILFSTSFANPTLPSGYSYKRRIGAVRVDSSGNILPFTQVGDEFIWSNAMYDVQGITTLGTTSTLFALSVPPDVKVSARVRAGIITTNATAQCAVRSPDENSALVTTFGSGSGHQMEVSNFTNSASGLAELLVRTNTSRQVAAIADQPSGNTFYIRTVGWFDDRGRSY